MVEVLVILDGASEPLGAAPTSLETASTPALDALAATGTLSRLRTVAPWLAPGSEAAIPALLGWTPPAPVDRGAVEAAAHGIDVAAGERAWRVDVLRGAGGGRADDATTARAVVELRAAAPHHAVHALAGHRLLLVGPAPLPKGAHVPGLHVWPEGIVPPPSLGPETVVIGARGAAIGIARLMGAATVVPAGATGQPDSDLAAKTQAALAAIVGGAAQVVVHVGGPDEAAHQRDRAAKVAAIARADRDVIAPLADAVRLQGGTLRVCSDHGCDPVTGEHDGTPVPCLNWATNGDHMQSAHLTGVQIACDPAEGRLTERAVVALAEAA